MNILRLIYKNLTSGTVSYRLPHTHECTSNRYRGLIVNDADRCVGCGACVYVCPTGALEVSRAGETYEWDYDPGKCTFCGRCIDRCKPGSLSMKSELPPLYHIQGELRTELHMVRKRPVRPAAPAKPVPAAAATQPPGAAATTQPAPVAAAAAAAPAEEAK